VNRFHEFPPLSKYKAVFVPGARDDFCVSGDEKKISRAFPGTFVEASFRDCPSVKSNSTRV
jgi:hypothetical protein